jgi:hypothetical protein
VPNGASSSGESIGNGEFKQFLNKKHGPKNCSSCQSALKFISTKGFHEDANWGVLGDVGEMLVGRTNLEMYACPTCLRVEFFASDRFA